MVDSVEKLRGAVTGGCNKYANVFPWDIVSTRIQLFSFVGSHMEYTEYVTVNDCQTIDRQSVVPISVSAMEWHTV